MKYEVFHFEISSFFSKLKVFVLCKLANDDVIRGFIPKMDHIIKNISENKIVTLFKLGTLNKL